MLSEAEVWEMFHKVRYGAMPHRQQVLTEGDPQRNKLQLRAYLLMSVGFEEALRQVLELEEADPAPTPDGEGGPRLSREDGPAEDGSDMPFEAPSVIGDPDEVERPSALPACGCPVRVTNGIPAVQHRPNCPESKRR